MYNVKLDKTDVGEIHVVQPRKQKSRYVETIREYKKVSSKGWGGCPGVRK